ncbi:MAG TPA: AsnC family protein, partial [Chloroflexota bacterium]|nr:AsnC family protein [Chloroflexota bacterium]
MLADSVEYGTMSNGVEQADLKLDDLDRSIIALLQPDGRRPFADAAAELHVSEGTVRQRYKRLVES